jgi:hypothetical protein
MGYFVGENARMDWENKDAVIAYAERLGSGQTVFKHPDRPNYNITHTSRTDRYEKAWVVHQTS